MTAHCRAPKTLAVSDFIMICINYREGKSSFAFVLKYQKHFCLFFFFLNVRVSCGWRTWISFWSLKLKRASVFPMHHCQDSCLCCGYVPLVLIEAFVEWVSACLSYKSSEYSWWTLFLLLLIILHYLMIWFEHFQRWDLIMRWAKIKYLKDIIYILILIKLYDLNRLYLSWGFYYCTLLQIHLRILEMNKV